MTATEVTLNQEYTHEKIFYIIVVKPPEEPIDPVDPVDPTKP